MRNVIFQEFVTIDGMAAGPDESVDFVPDSTQGDDSFGRHQLEFMDTIDTILLGRVTYEMFAGYWPAVTEGEDKQFADKINATEKIVFSSTLDRAPWGDFADARIVKNNAAGEVARLRQQAGKNLVIWGSISLAQSLMSEGLIDEYQLVVCPIVMGKGRHVFGESDNPLDMKLRRTKSFDRGTVLLAYSSAEE